MALLSVIHRKQQILLQNTLLFEGKEEGGRRGAKLSVYSNNSMFSSTLLSSNNTWMNSSTARSFEKVVALCLIIRWGGFHGIYWDDRLISKGTLYISSMIVHSLHHYRPIPQIDRSSEALHIHPTSTSIMYRYPVIDRTHKFFIVL